MGVDTSQMQFYAVLITALAAAPSVLASAIPQNFGAIDDCEASKYASVLICDKKDFGEDGAFSNGDCAYFSTTIGDNTCEFALNPQSKLATTDNRGSLLVYNTCYVLGAMNDKVR